MATDDDKQIPEPDPWAGLDIGGPEDKGEEFTFAFDGLEGDTANPPEPSVEIPADPLTTHAAEDGVVASTHGEPSEAEEAPFGDIVVEDGDGEQAFGEQAFEDVPLAVFPPPEAEATGSEVLIGTGSSGIIAMPNVADGSGEEEAVDQHAAEAAEEGFDEKDIAHELGLADVEGDAVAAESLADRNDPDGGADFGDPFAEPHSDDVSFDAGMMGGTLPFSDSEQLDPAAGAEEPWQDDPASIPLTAAVAAAGAAVVAAPAGSRPAAAGKKGGGLGQMVGVVLGGVMALPITYAILIWGFQKDPFKFGKQVPEQLAFLLPQKLQPGYKPPRKAGSGPNLDAAPSLDDLPMAVEAAAEPTSEPDATAAEEATETEPADAADAAEPTEAKPMKTEALAGTPAEPDAAAETSEPDETPEPAADPDGESGADTVAAAPAMADTKLAAVPKPDALPGLDALMADAGEAVVASVPAAAPAALPPLDLTGVETASERATQAMDALEAVADPLSPDRDRLLVAWYRRLATLGEELVRLETVAADSGRPMSPTPVSAADLLDRICVSDTAVADLDRLGGMWLGSQKRRADGVTLVATLGASRQVGPYWSTRASVSGAQADGTDRSMAIISRLAPPADAGDRVVVSGVMFDGDAVWAADMRPVAPQPASDGGLE